MERLRDRVSVGRIRLVDVLGGSLPGGRVTIDIMIAYGERWAKKATPGLSPAVWATGAKLVVGARPNAQGMLVSSDVLRFSPAVSSALTSARE